MITIGNKNMPNYLFAVISEIRKTILVTMLFNMLQTPDGGHCR